MSTKTAIAKVSRLDADIEALRTRLESKLAERESILAELIADGEAIRAALGLVEAPEAPEDRPVALATGRAFTEEEILDIRTRNAAGTSQSALARHYGVSQPTIFGIVRRRTYKDVA